MKSNAYLPFATAQDKETAFYIATISTEPSQKIVHRPLGIEDYQFLYTASGSGIAFVSGSAIELKKGTLLFHPPNTPHEYYNTSETWVTKYITFNGCGISSFFNYSTSAWDNLGEFEFEKWFNVLSSYAYIPTQVNTRSVTLYSMLLELKENIAHSTTLSKERHHLLTQAMHYLADSKEHQLDVIANRLGISPSHFCRIFKEFSGYRPFEYMNLVRIQQAKALLKNSQMPISEISASVGYESHSYFSKLFKSIVGISPTQYRNG